MSSVFTLQILLSRLPEVPFVRNSTLDLTLDEAPPLETKDRKNKEDTKRKSGMSFLPNISELDREASEIVKNKNLTQNPQQQIPEFMKIKESRVSVEESPRRRSAKDLIAKFNAITGVSKSGVFQKHLGKQISLDEARQRQEQLLENHKKRIEDIDKKKEEKFPLMKSESASAVKAVASPKMERKPWKCPKCHLENEYWRIICHSCSAIKPYFDDFSSSSASPTKVSTKEQPPKETPVPAFERSKTQIGFSALATYNLNNHNNNNDEKVDSSSKKEERERLKKMLIEMKNSLPKRKSHMQLRQNNRSSVIVEAPDELKPPEPVEDQPEKTQEEKVAEILIGTTQTVYENIKVRRTDQPKPVKVSSAAQTSAVVKKIVPQTTLKKLIENHKNENPYEPMKVQDFNHIYAAAPTRVYANLARNDELSLFFNVPKGVSNLRNGSKLMGGSQKDTLEINRLLRRLETAIAKGEMTDAAIFAKELAQLKVNCSVIRQKSELQKDGGKQQGYQ